MPLFQSEVLPLDLSSLPSPFLRGVPDLPPPTPHADLLLTSHPPRDSQPASPGVNPKAQPPSPSFMGSRASSSFQPPPSWCQRFAGRDRAAQPADSAPGAGACLATGTGPGQTEPRGGHTPTTGMRQDSWGCSGTRPATDGRGRYAPSSATLAPTLGQRAPQPPKPAVRPAGEQKGPE